MYSFLNKCKKDNDDGNSIKMLTYNFIFRYGGLDFLQIMKSWKISDAWKIPDICITMD